MVVMRGGRRRRSGPWVAAGAGLVLVMALVGITAVALGGRDGLQNAADTGQLTGLLISAGGVSVAMLRWARQRTRTTPVLAAPTTAELAEVKQRPAGLVAQQWTHEATLRSLDDPDPIPVRPATSSSPPGAGDPVARRAATRASVRASVPRLPLGLPYGLLFGLVAGQKFGLVAGLAFGLVIGLMLGRHHAWVAYVIATRRLRSMMRLTAPAICALFGLR